MSQENVELVRSISAAHERGDYGSAEWAHPDIEYVIVGGLTAGSWKGRAAMAKAAGELFSTSAGFGSKQRSPRGPRSIETRNCCPAAAQAARAAGRQGRDIWRQRRSVGASMRAKRSSREPPWRVLFVVLSGRERTIGRTSLAGAQVQRVCDRCRPRGSHPANAHHTTAITAPTSPERWSRPPRAQVGHRSRAP